MRRRQFLQTIAALSASVASTWASCSFELQGKASSEIQLLPAGIFRASDGRPAEKIEGWKIDAAIAARLIAQINSLKRDLVIDYDHQTLLAETNGQPAPAAGWFKNVEWREGQGLFATDVRWTERAKAHIEAGEFKYISPVFAYNHKTGVITQLQMAAITNFPGLDGMAEVSARAAARFNVTQPQETHNMELLKLLLAALGLPDTTTEADAITGVTALKAKADKVDALETQVVALKAQTAPDPAKFVPVETVNEMRTQLAALSAQVTGRDLDEVVAAALADGRLLPAQEKWARDLGKKDLAQLKAYIDTAQPIPALQRQQTQGKKLDTNAALDDSQLAVCKALGLSAEEYKKTRDAQAA